MKNNTMPTEGENSEKTLALAGLPATACSPEQVIRALQEQIQHDIKMCAEAIEEVERDRDHWKKRATESHAEMMAMKERLMKLADAFANDAASHRKLSDLGQTELTQICHRSACDAYKNAERRLMDAVHHEAAF